MLKQIYTCDVCGTEKQQTNHWWAVTYNIDRETITVQSWAIRIGDIFHCCGEACLIKKTSELVGKIAEAQCAKAAK